MFGRTSRRHKIMAQVVASIIAIPFALPLIAILATSAQGQGFIANYSAVFTQTPFLADTLNSAAISIGTIVVVYCLTMLAGYAFSKLHLSARALLFNSFLVGLSLPSIALIVPLFTIVQKLGLFNNYFSVILPLSAVTLPFTLLLVRNYLRGIPNEILEAAKLDGCNSFSTLIRVVLPLSKPITAVVIVWAFLQSWNEFFLPLLFLQNPALQTLTQIPTYFTSTYGSDVPKIFAALVLISVPIVVTYLLLQKFFERGLSAGAIK
jgi:raffinose/stachyose/melibiose transport system permease protein